MSVNLVSAHFTLMGFHYQMYCMIKDNLNKTGLKKREKKIYHPHLTDMDVETKLKQ